MGWLDTAKALRVGGSVRAEHCVGGDKSAIISAGDKGWSVYCFRCGETVEFELYPEAPLAERIARLVEAKTQDAVAELAISLPGPAIHELGRWPVGHRAWLHKAGMFNADIAALGIYYNERLDRVILPVVRGSSVIYWQGRGFDKKRAKYINPKVANPPAAEFGIGSCIVLVEDYLSAWKVGKVTEAWGLLGTQLKAEAMSKLLVAGKPVVTWLDPDKAGITKASVMRRALRAYGVRVIDVLSRRDPKLLSTTAIEQHIQEAMRG